MKETARAVRPNCSSLILTQNISLVSSVGKEAAPDIIFVVSKASDLIFKIVIFHDVPRRSSTLYTGFFFRTGWGRRMRWNIGGVENSWGGVNSSEMAWYFLKPIMQDGS